MELAESLSESEAANVIEVPPMMGVDEDMRRWSFFMLLEHNAIVNRSISEIACSLAQGKEPTGPGAIDLKKDVMPSAAPGLEQIGAFQESVADHLDRVRSLPVNWSPDRKRHPIFGMLTAHGWHRMFHLHLTVHLKQANAIVAQARGN